MSQRRFGQRRFLNEVIYFSGAAEGWSMPAPRYISGMGKAASRGDIDGLLGLRTRIKVSRFFGARLEVAARRALGEDDEQLHS